MQFITIKYVNKSSDTLKYIDTISNNNGTDFLNYIYLDLKIMTKDTVCSSNTLKSKQKS